MVFSDGEGQITIKEETESETELTSSTPSSPSLPSPPAAHCHNISLEPLSLSQERRQRRTATKTRRVGAGAEPDTVILVSRKNGKREHILLRSLLKTKGAPGRIEKRVVISASPRPELKHTAMGSRTQLRQTLERQQVLEKEEREKQEAQARQQQQQQSQTIAMPSSYHSAEVPPQVLQVGTRLQHPTQYHIKQKQEQAVRTYLTTSSDCHLPAHSMPNINLPSTIDTQWISGSAPTELEGATGFDDDVAFLEGIVLETPDMHQDSDLLSIQPSLTQMSSTLPPATMFAPFNQAQETSSSASASAKSSSSCPPAFQSQINPTGNMTEEDKKLLARERQKKDNHNLIERRRRYNINDKIKELGQLLPKSFDPDTRLNKGTILKASVDYMKLLKKTEQQNEATKEENVQLHKANQRLRIQMEQLRNALSQYPGLNLNGLLEDLTSETMVAPSSVMSMQQQPVTMAPVLKTEDPSPSATFSNLMAQDFGNTIHMEFMEDSSPVNGDPMLTSNPVSPDTEDTF